MEQNSAAAMTFKEQEHMAMVSAPHHVIFGGTESEGTPIPVLRGTCGINDGAVYSVPTTTFSRGLNENDCTTSSGAGGKVSKKYIGVRKRPSGKWAAEIRDPSIGKGLWIGTFRTAEEAARARDMKAIEFHKEKAKTNFSLSDYTEFLQPQKSEVYNEGDVRPEKMITIGAIGESNAGIFGTKDDENGYDWSFDQDEEYGFPQFKVVDSP